MEDNGGPTATTPADIEAADGGAGNIRFKVTYASNNFDLFISPQSTFADLKRAIAKATGLDPKVQTVLFRGKENDDHESLDMVGVKDNAKVIVIENSPTKEENLVEVKENIEEISRGLEAVNLVREENNQFAEQVASLEAVVCSGTQVADKDFIFLTEMLMRQLLKLDGIDCEGEGRIQRKLEVRRVQGLVDKLDNLRVKNTSNVSETPPGEPSSQGLVDNPTSNNPGEPSLPSSKVTQDWEIFE